MRIRYISLSVLLLVAFAAPKKAGSGGMPQEAAEPNPSTSRQEAKSKSVAPDYSHEPIVYVFIHQNLRYEDDGTGMREIQGKIRVQTAAGLAQAGQLIFDYNASNEKIEIRSVRIEKPDGTVVTAGPDSVQDLSAPLAREAPIYSDARQKHVTVPSLSVGDSVEYDAMLTSTPMLPGQFWNTVYFMNSSICLDEEVDLVIPRERQIKYASPDGTELTTRDDGDHRIYHWKRDTPAIPKSSVPSNDFKFDTKSMLEGFRPPLPPRIFFSTFQSWSEVGKWYAELERDRRVPTTEIRAKADEIVRGKTGELEKAEALYNWVSANIRYVSLSFGVGRYKPHAASEVLVNRYGDCKDKGALLEAFFAAEGLHAQPVLINSVAELNVDVPSPLQFDHLITIAQVAEQNVWLDSSIGVGPFGYLLPQLRGKQALVATDYGGSALQKIPETLPAASMYHINVQGEVNKDSKLDAKINLEIRGDLEVLYRILYSSLPTAKFNAIAPVPLTTGLKATYAAKFTDFVVDDATDISKPLHLQFHFVGDLLYVDMKPTSREAFFVALNQALFQKEGLLALLPGSQSKMNDFGKLENAKSVGAKEYSLTLAITVPSVKTDEPDIPQAVRFLNDVAEYDANANWDGQTLHAGWKLNLHIPEVSDVEAKEYADFTQNVIGSLTFEMPKEAKAVSIVANDPGSNTKSSTSVASTTKPASTVANDLGSNTKSSTPVASTTKPASPATPAKPGPSGTSTDPVNGGMRPHAEEVHDLYEQGRTEAKQQNYANAVDSFTSAVKLDPEYPPVWRELGRAQMYLRNYADAEADFRKYLALAPDDHLAYLNMAWALYEEKKYIEDVEMLEKRISNVPNDGDANARLGAAYLELRQPEKALPVLQKAVSIFPKYEYPQFNLARTYLLLHQENSAAAEFERAIKLDDTSNTRNSAAYMLAQANTHLEIAAMWADDAIESVELELNQTKIPLQPATMRRVGSIAAYWDTMGWIRFRQGKLDIAEKYIRAAAELADDSTVLMHLGKIYEAQERKDEAIEAYAETLASVPVTREMDDDEKEAHARLIDLVGSESLVDDRIKRSRPKLRGRRSVSVPNPSGLEGIAQYIVIISPGPKVIELQTVSADDPLARLKDAVRDAPMPQSFPDNTIQKLPRTGTLSCPRAELPCTFTFTSAAVASRIVSAD